ncbi:hypothetical protein A6U87_20630 [Rhizobium sp. AC44/96]|uniref:hypothetical protein n=1 Tax=unclassified Rhizobium TaxID=2613769 RepID=UPI00080F73B7|nr:MULTISPECIES: hypothetical protein [unclassified Rhizobium]MDM9621948.1 hypothetical protein [Rhizobium sp. S96]OCJ17218.1 hypothetical protein A6U87_20630 [Rhizobium sp. AC44/96]
MTQTTDFVTELIVAANQISSVTPLECRRLLERGIATTKALQETLLVNNKAAPVSAKVLAQIETMVPEVDAVPDVPACCNATTRRRRNQTTPGAGALSQRLVARIERDLRRHHHAPLNWLPADLTLMCNINHWLTAPRNAAAAGPQPKTLDSVQEQHGYH